MIASTWIYNEKSKARRQISIHFDSEEYLKVVWHLDQWNANEAAGLREIDVSPWLGVCYYIYSNDALAVID